MEVKEAVQTLWPIFKEKDWFRHFVNKTQPHESELHLVTAKGVRYCGDPRPPMKNMEFSAAIFGGAAGFMLQFLQLGQFPMQALESTQELYRLMDWGTPQIHNDDHAEWFEGCGFLSRVVDITHINAGVVGELSARGYAGQMIFNLLEDNGAEVVTLTGDHMPEKSKFLVNFRAGTTINPFDATDGPTYLSDLWIVSNLRYRKSFNILVNQHLAYNQHIYFSTNQLVRWHLAQALATGLRLGVLKPDFSNLYLVV